MRALVLTLGTLLYGVFSYSQSLENEAKIIEYLGQDRYNSIVQSNPSYLEFLDAKITDGYAIDIMADEKTGSFKILNEIPVLDPNNKDGKNPSTISVETFLQKHEDGTLNILLYQLPADKEKMTYYVLGNSGMVLMLFPVDYITKKANQ